MFILKVLFYGIVSYFLFSYSLYLLFYRRCREIIQRCCCTSVKNKFLFLRQTEEFSCRFFEFEDPTKSKLTRKKETILTGTQWQIDIDENLLPDERILLERDFSIEIPRQSTPPAIVQSPVCTFFKYSNNFIFWLFSG